MKNAQTYLTNHLSAVNVGQVKSKGVPQWRIASLWSL